MTLVLLDSVGSPGENVRFKKIRDALSSPDNAALATFKAAHDADDAGGGIDLTGRSAVLARGIFTNSGASAVVRWYFYAKDANGDEDTTKDPIAGVDLTLTAKEGTNGASEYVGDTQADATLGFPIGRLKLISISAGSVDLYAGDLA